MSSSIQTKEEKTVKKKYREINQLLVTHVLTLIFLIHKYLRPLLFTACSLSAVIAVGYYGEAGSLS